MSSCCWPAHLLQEGRFAWGAADRCSQEALRRDPRLCCCRPQRRRRTENRTSDSRTLPASGRHPRSLDAERPLHSWGAARRWQGNPDIFLNFMGWIKISADFPFLVSKPPVIHGRNKTSCFLVPPAGTVPAGGFRFRQWNQEAANHTRASRRWFPRSAL